MRKKIIAAAVAASLSLAVTPVASAQLSSGSSLPTLSSGSIVDGSTPNSPTANLEEVEERFEKIMGDAGHTRVAEHDRAAEEAMQDAKDGEIVFVKNDLGNVPDFAEGASLASGYSHLLYRFPVEHAGTVLDNIKNASGLGLDFGVYVPYGLAVDSEESWAYITFSLPLDSLLGF